MIFDKSQAKADASNPKRGRKRKASPERKDGNAAPNQAEKKKAHSTFLPAWLNRWTWLKFVPNAPEIKVLERLFCSFKSLSVAIRKF